MMNFGVSVSECLTVLVCVSWEIVDMCSASVCVSVYAKLCLSWASVSVSGAFVLLSL